MTRLLILTLITFFMTMWESNAQISCDELTKTIKDNADHIATDRSYFDDAISKVSFYSLEIEYDEYYFALVSFQSNIFKEYTYQIPKEAMRNYRSSYFEDSAEKFWKYIQPYNQVLDCSPQKRRGNKYSPR